MKQQGSYADFIAQVGPEFYTRMLREHDVHEACVRIEEQLDRPLETEEFMELHYDWQGMADDIE